MEEINGRFMQLATRPLTGNEAGREAASDELTSRIAHAGQDEGAIRKATERLEAKKPEPARRLPLIAGGMIALLAIVLCILIPQHWQEARLLQGIHRQGLDGRLAERVLGAMGPAAADVPLRANSYRTPGTFRPQVEALRREDPEDPARYRLHAQWFSTFTTGGSEGLPPDYESRWRELDPGNALWALSAADLLTDRSVSRGGFGGPRVLDESVYQKAIAMFHEAAKCDHSRSHVAQIHELQLRSFSSDGSLKSATMEETLRSLAGFPDRLQFFSLGRALRIQSGRFVAAGDREGLRALAGDLRKVLFLTAGDFTAAHDNILPRFSYIAGELAGDCHKLGLVEEAMWLERLRDLGKFRPRPVPAASRAGHGSSRIRWLAPWVVADAGASADELKPGRLAEYAVAERFSAVVGVLLGLVTLAACSIEILRRGASVRGLARGLMPLFRRSDWVWLFGLGLLFPLGGWAAVVWLSPLGCRDIGLSHYAIKGFPMMQPWLSQSLGGLVFVLVLLLQTARWRWAKRGAFLALRAERLWIGWTMVLVAALFVPVQGIVRYLPSHEMQFLLYGSAVGGIPLLWLLWQALMGLFTPEENALGGQLLVRTLVPGLIAMSLLMLAAIPLLRKSERSWVARDELSKPDPEGSGYTMLERRSLDPIRERLLKALE